MPTELQSAASRANGAKSKGPKTAEGRQKSSQNSLQHGYTAVSTILIDGENPQEFMETVAEYNNIYQPASLVESDLVDNMIAARWKVQRLMVAEVGLIKLEASRRANIQTDPLPPDQQLGDVFIGLADDSKAYTLITRYQSQLNRHHIHCFLILRMLQKERMEKAAQPAALQPAQPEPPAPPIQPMVHPAPETQPAHTPSACGKKSRNEPGAVRSIRPFRLNLRAFTPRIATRSATRIATLRATQRLSIG